VSTPPIGASQATEGEKWYSAFLVDDEATEEVSILKRQPFDVRITKLNLLATTPTFHATLEAFDKLFESCVALLETR
jgi:hypothetical protein